MIQSQLAAAVLAGRTSEYYATKHDIVLGGPDLPAQQTVQQAWRDHCLSRSGAPASYVGGRDAGSCCHKDGCAMLGLQEADEALQEETFACSSHDIWKSA